MEGLRAASQNLKANMWTLHWETTHVDVSTSLFAKAVAALVLVVMIVSSVRLADFAFAGQAS